MVALSFFIPLLIGTGGNMGSQTVTLIVRAMALGEVTLARHRLDRVQGDARRADHRRGHGASSRSGARGCSGSGADIGGVVALTILAICIWSATVAAALPLLLRALRIDPAVVSAPLITTLVDGTGLVIYFTIARILLQL